jgi:hypothetical protein
LGGGTCGDELGASVVGWMRAVGLSCGFVGSCVVFAACALHALGTDVRGE